MHLNALILVCLLHPNGWYFWLTSFPFRSGKRIDVLTHVSAHRLFCKHKKSWSTMSASQHCFSKESCSWPLLIKVFLSCVLCRRRRSWWAKIIAFVQQTSTSDYVMKNVIHMHIAIILSVWFTYLIHINNVSKDASANKSEKPDFGASGLSSRIRGCDGSSSNLASSSLQLQQMYSEMNLQYDLDATPPPRMPVAKMKV